MVQKNENGRSNRELLDLKINDKLLELSESLYEEIKSKKIREELQDLTKTIKFTFNDRFTCVNNICKYKTEDDAYDIYEMEKHQKLTAIFARQ